MNLGGRRVRMSHLVELVTGLGYRGVWTYANSGNVVFEATGARAALEGTLEGSFESALGFEATTFVRTAVELRRIVTVQPFDVAPGDTYFVTFLKDRPPPRRAEALEALTNDMDRLVVRGRDVHWLMHGKSTETTLTTRMWDEIVGHHRSTSRNINMLRRLVRRMSPPEEFVC